MRLAQLARKLSVKPATIVEFLSSQGITLEDNANTKVEDEHVKAVVSHFAPDLFDTQPEPALAPQPAEAEAMEETVESSMEEQAPAEVTIQEELIIAAPIQEESADANTLPDVIRAPKIELTGLKVIGKIELPEKKKKEEETVSVETAETVVAEVEKKNTPRERSVRTDRKPKSQQRSNRNPLAEARERERREQEEKRKQEIERKKEIRTKNYLKKVKVVAPAKRAKPSVPITNTKKPKQEEPKTLWGKFVKWLTTY